MSLDEAAKVLGVHYMTAYRYVRQGKLTATRVKGVWQVTPHALSEFQRRADARKENPRASEDSRRTGDYVGELLRCLLNADGGGAWGVLQRAIDAGNDMMAEPACGISVPSGHPKDVAAALERLLAMSPEERELTGVEAKAHVLINNAYPVLARRFLAAVQGVPLE